MTRELPVAHKSRSCNGIPCAYIGRQRKPPEEYSMSIPDRENCAGNLGTAAPPKDHAELTAKAIRHDEWLMDEAIRGSFPASDPASPTQPGSLLNQRFIAREQYERASVQVQDASGPSYGSIAVYSRFARPYLPATFEGGHVDANSKTDDLTTRGPTWAKSRECVSR